MHKLWLLASTAGKGLLQCVLIVALTFLFCRTIPGDAVDVLGLEGGLTAEQAAAIRQALKLDDPWLVQFGDWLSAASRGDLGQSLRFGRSVSDMLLNAIPVTLQLAGWAFALGLFLALGLSLWAAAHKLWLLASTAGKGLLQCVLIVALTFLFCRTIPGDAVDVLGLEGGLTAEQAAAIRQALKLDDPWLVQFGDWLSAASRGDLGQSLRFGRSVSDMLLNAIPVTLQLAGWAFALGLFLALGLSLWAAARQSAFADSLVEGLNAWSIAMPTFCAGVIFILLFCIELHWLPVIGSFILPAVIMGLDSGGTIVKPLREELKESAALPYVRTAKAKGLAPLRIAVFHILPNAAGILLSLSGLVAGSLVAGTLTMGILFGLPGIGSLALNAIQGRDTPVVLAAVSFIAVSLVLINTAVDALHKLFDPRMTP